MQADISFDYLQRHDVLLRDGHFVLTGGDHSPWYLDMRRLAHHTQWLDGVSEQFYHQLGPDIDIYIGAGSLGQALSTLTATWSPHGSGIWCSIDTRGYEKRALFDRKFAHFANLLRDKRVAIVDDTLTTGETLRQVAILVKHHGGEVVSAATIVNRSPGLVVDPRDVPEVFSLLTLEGIRTYSPDKCPECLAKIDVNPYPGHGEKWLRKHSANPPQL